MFFDKPAGLKYVPRTDVNKYDFTVTDFIANNAFHNLSLAGIVPSNAKAVVLYVEIRNATNSGTIRIIPEGHINDYYMLKTTMLVENRTMYMQGIIQVNSTGIIQYALADLVWTTVNITVAGWWV